VKTLNKMGTYRLLQRFIAVELGDFIQLDGFVEKEPGELVVVKKIIGNYVKHISVKLPNFERLSITQKPNSHYTIESTIFWNGKEASYEHKDDNLFFALDTCLKKLERETAKV
jgi:hypothetical protein